MTKPTTSACKKLSPAEWSGVIAIVAAVLLFFAAPSLTTLPLILLVISCVVAPFFPRWAFFLPIVSRGRTGLPAVAITFDDGPDPITTEPLLQLLEKHSVHATFFVTGLKARKHPALIRRILTSGHTIGNHTYRHDNLIMLKGLGKLTAEIEEAQRALGEFGIVPSAFRPPVGITNPRLASALERTGLYVVNFSRRAGDWGNRRIRSLSTRILKNLRGDDIIMLHDTAPDSEENLRYFLTEVDRLLTGIAARGLRIVALEELIGRPVMTSCSGATRTNDPLQDHNPQALKL
jgi:peptidoglycan/xylan/chitin deacetylase (PgdA/CDA1 family)